MGWELPPFLFFPSANFTSYSVGGWPLEGNVGFGIPGGC